MNINQKAQKQTQISRVREKGYCNLPKLIGLRGER